MSFPNVVFVIWHDAGRWFGCYGTPCVRTPNVDRLAGEGCRFSNIFSACAICSPSRAAMMTGRYCQANGVMSLTNTPFGNRIHPHVPHLAARLGEMGYATALFGVQHECAHEHVHEVLRVEEQFDTDPWPQAPVSAANFERWLAERDDERSFYAQIGFFEAHLGSFLNNDAKPNYPLAGDEENGLHVPPHIEETEYGRQAIRTLQGYLHRGDTAIGRILKALDEHGQTERTLVVMCVDHGVGLPRAKTTCYDPGIGVSWILRWPGVVPAGTVVDALATHVDILPTLLDLIGLPVPAECDGHSFAAHVRGQSREELNDAVFSHMVETTRSIRTRNHKLIRNFRPPARFSAGPLPVLQKAETHRTAEDGPPHVELYDLRRDPNEFNNLAAEPAFRSILEELNGRLWDFLLDVDDFIVHDPVRTPWQRRTREELETHCRSVGRPCPPATGPLA